MTASAEPRAGFLDRADDTRLLVGLILKMTNHAVVELAGHLGFDFVLLDTEHGIGEGAELDHHLRAADAASVPAIVRVSALSRTEIARALDGGAAGVVVPQVGSAREAETAVALAHYPPVGRRGLATSTRAGHHGVVDTATHLAAGRSTLVVVQIESRAGVENCAEILAVPGVSAVWIGLNDLSLEYGRHGQLDHPDVQDAVDTVVVAARSAGVPVFVIADDEATAERWASCGARALLVNFLTIAARGLSTVKESHRRLVPRRSFP